MGWLIALGVVLGLAFLPLGFSAVYRDAQPGVWLILGPVKLKVFPLKNKKEKSKKEPQKPAPQKNKKAKAQSQKGASYQDFKPVFKAIIDFLSQFRRKIRVSHLELKLVLAGGDPSDLAVNYGKAWAALGNLMPQLERFFVIKKRDLAVECDFVADKTLIYARLDATITLGRTLHLLSWHGIRIIRELLKLKKLRKGGAEI